nr:type II toxin-antitoxin system HicA family toxin [Bifidobacterium amazonense]
MAGVRFKEIEKILLADGWTPIAQKGSHRQYVHPTKPGKVTVPDHRGDVNPYIVKAIWKQAGINEKRTK